MDVVVGIRIAEPAAGVGGYGPVHVPDVEGVARLSRDEGWRAGGNVRGGWGRAGLVGVAVCAGELLPFDGAVVVVAGECTPVWGGVCNWDWTMVDGFSYLGFAGCREGGLPPSLVLRGQGVVGGTTS